VPLIVAALLFRKAILTDQGGGHGRFGTSVRLLNRA